MPVRLSLCIRDDERDLNSVPPLLSPEIFGHCGSAPRKKRSPDGIARRELAILKSVMIDHPFSWVVDVSARDRVVGRRRAFLRVRKDLYLRVRPGRPNIVSRHDDIGSGRVIRDDDFVQGKNGGVLPLNVADAARSGRAGLANRENAPAIAPPNVYSPGQGGQRDREVFQYGVQRRQTCNWQGEREKWSRRIQDPDIIAQKTIARASSAKGTEAANAR